jgi:hypothetical protein
VEWYTPAEIIEASRRTLGRIDDDPSSCKAANAVVKAARYFTKEDNGLLHDWFGTVFLNPGYSSDLIGPFSEKLVTSVRAGTVPAAIAVVRADSTTKWFSLLSSEASAICLGSTRLAFWKPDRTDTALANFGSAIFYFGPDRDRFQQEFQEFGAVWFGVQRNGVEASVVDDTQRQIEAASVWRGGAR